MAPGRRRTDDVARKAGAFLIAEALALVSSVIMARAFAETPWLMLPFLFALFSFSTYFGTIWKLGSALLLIEVVCLDTFYGVVFAPQDDRLGRGGSVWRKRYRLWRDRSV